MTTFDKMAIWMLLITYFAIMAIFAFPIISRDIIYVINFWRRAWG